MTRSYFIAATGTGVGKTFTTCALLHAAKGALRGHKPIISGYDPHDPNDDCVQIAAYDARPHEAISPWRFQAPLSPDMAARREGRSLTLSELVDWTRATTASGQHLIETVGGVMVPINATHTTRDWMAQSGLPVLLVAGSYLGTLSHTLTALDTLRRAGIPIAALVVNESCEQPVALEETLESLRPHAGDVPLLAQPRVGSPREATIIHSLYERLC